MYEFYILYRETFLCFQIMNILILKQKSEAKFTEIKTLTTSALLRTLQMQTVVIYLIFFFFKFFIIISCNIKVGKAKLLFVVI